MADTVQRIPCSLGALMGQNSISLRHEALALKGAHNHVDLRDDAFDALVGLLRLQLELQYQPVNLVDYQT